MYFTFKQFLHETVIDTSRVGGIITSHFCVVRLESTVKSTGHLNADSWVEVVQSLDHSHVLVKPGLPVSVDRRTEPLYLDYGQKISPQLACLNNMLHRCSTWQ